jgi:polyhydroxyalkanoate synthesis regulator phasin
MAVKKIKRGIYFSVGLASLAKKEIDKHMDKLVKEGKLQTKGARKVAGKVLSVAKREGIKLEQVLVRELKKEVKKVAPKVKKVAKKTYKRKK